jgi:beta-aspartyl-peptidase (threonine type)
MSGAGRGRAVLVASTNGAVGLPSGRAVLEAGGSALDAVEAATRPVEDDPSDQTVGYGGFPNVVGDVELDALVMEGTTRRSGAVGALRGFRHPVSVARAVMERLPHVLVVGPGAARFAAEVGAEERDMLTPAMAALWARRVAPQLEHGTPLVDVAGLAADPERAGGTVDVLALDRDGRLAVAVSTSGWAWKYPGRLGDSPVVGAGGYADDRGGAAGCTGMGELAIRAGTARMVVAALAEGRSAEDACREAIVDLRRLGADRPPLVHVVCLAADGSHAGASTHPGRTYVYWEEGMDAPAEAARVGVP